MTPRTSDREAARVVKTLIIPFLLGLFALVMSGCQVMEKSDRSWESKVRTHHGTNPGGQLLLKAMEAHGGMEQWYGNGILSFRWIYMMKDRGPDAKVDTFQSVDLSSMEAIHQVPGTDIRFGWTGDAAWIDPADASFAIPARFWALTPIYFVGIPFVFADTGAHAELMEDFQFEGVNWNQVKITFSSDSGDAPDDTYTLLIHPNNRYVGGVRYTVTSPLVTKGTPLPEKLLTLDHQEWIKGIYLPTYHRTFKMKDGRPTEKIREAKVSQLTFEPRGSVDFRRPVGAKKL